MYSDYTDYGPNPRKTERVDVRKIGRWDGRPFCDMCGPFRGRYLRLQPSGEYRCRGCDRENGTDGGTSFDLSA